MKTGNRIIINTIALWTRIVIGLFISLWSVPLVLRALGENDYGLYNLVAGVIAMLSFLKGAMTVSTQRFMSVTIGKNDDEILNKTYNAGIVLHLIIGLAIVLGFEICGLFLFDGFLNIEQSRIYSAKIIYQILIASTFLTVITVPYNAAINAHEDLIVFSLIGIGDALLKLGLAFFLFTVNSDRLIVYGLGIAGIAVVNIIITRVYVFIKYKNLSTNFKRYFEWEQLKQMLLFASWNTFGSVAMIGRNQGIAVVINKFFGTVINSSYGIANQMNGALASFSAVLQQSINPQLMKSEGMNKRDRMLKISYMSSKFTTMILLLAAIPLIIEMPFILKVWLTVVPPYTIEFGRWIIGLAVLNQLSVGIMSAIQAGGRIGKYQFTMSIMLLSNIPLSVLLLYLGLPPYFVMVGCVGIEVLTLFVRLFFAKALVDFNVSYFLSNVLLRVLIPTFLSVALGIIVTQYFAPSFLRLLSVVIISIITFPLSSWTFALSSDERDVFMGVFNQIIIKLKK